MKYLFLLIFFLTIGIHEYQCAVTERSRRVKRSNTISDAKIIGNVTTTTVATIEKDKHSKANTTKPKREAEDEFKTQMHSEIEKFILKTPTNMNARHAKLNESESVIALHDSRPGSDKEHCTDVRHPKSLLLLNTHSTDEQPTDEAHKDETYFEYLKGKSTGDAKYRHDRFGRALFVKDNSAKKSKRNAIKSTMHHKLHKDNKDHKHKRSESETQLDNFMQLVKMLVEMTGSMHTASSLHAPLHAADAEPLAPIAGERLIEVIYKPMTIDSTGSVADDVALTNANEYLNNEFAGLPQPQHAVLPFDNAGYHEFTLPLIQNFSPLKLLANAVESGIAFSNDNKDDSDSDEYEMTCPVHFKRSTDNVGSKDGNGGTLELCTCHLYHKNKQVL